MPKLAVILENIKSLQESLTHFNAKDEVEDSDYWKIKNNLSELFKQSGDLYLQEGEYLLAVKQYSESYLCTQRFDIYDKLNLFLKAESKASSIPEVSPTNAETLYLCGLQAQSGIGVSVNYVAAAYYYQAAAEIGYAPAQHTLGAMYLFGARGFVQDNALAVIWLRKAADQNYAPSQNYLGYICGEGKLVEKDDTKAVAWYQKAAEQGNADAQFNLGVVYTYGRGLAKNNIHAVAWYKKAAEQGYVAAQNNLGFMYENGLGVAKDDTQAVAWFQKAAEQGQAIAQRNFGLIYEAGHGVAKDDTQAVAWYRKAAEQGDVEAQYSLGFMYENGQGVAQDDTQAIIWYHKAIEQNNVNAKIALNKLYLWFWVYGPLDAEHVKLYRNDLRQGIQNAEKMLAQCKRVNPQDFNCQYHSVLGVLKADYGDLHQLYQTYPDKTLSAIMQDDFLNDDLRTALLLHLCEFSKKHNIDIVEDLLVYVGNYYFERLPKAKDFPEQKEWAYRAIECFERISVNSPHYDAAADAIVLMRERFEGKELNELYAQYFTNKGKLVPHEKNINDFNLYITRRNEGERRQSESIAQFGIWQNSPDGNPENQDKIITHKRLKK